MVVNNETARASRNADPVVSQVVIRDGKHILINYSMTEEYTLVRKFSRQPSAPPMELMEDIDDDAPPPYEACCVRM
jgi:hypothetical protein